MRYYARIKIEPHQPQIGGFYFKKAYYHPIFWHIAIDQDRPIGSRSTFVEHMHDFYHLVLYTQGRGQYSVEGQFFPAEPGTLVMISPLQRHDFVTRRGLAVYSEITFSYENDKGRHLKITLEKLLSMMADRRVRFDDALKLPPEQRLQLQHLFVQLTDYLNSSRDQALYHAHRTLLLIFDFLMANCTLSQTASAIDDRFVRIRQWIEEHHAEPLSMDALARKIGLSKGYFFRAFKRSFGISPLAYQQQLRIEAAKTLLRATGLRCNEIAHRVGFTDPYFFHRIFKRSVGQTPKQFRKQKIV